jgi:RNA polymerase sigma-70 factor (ECF subfamily)
MLRRRGNPPPRSDAELILASQREPLVFREVYDRWAETLLGYFARRVHDPEVAADLLAETFAVAFEKRHRFRDIGRPDGAWLYGIASRELSRYFRRQTAELRAVRRLGLTVPPVDEASVAAIERLADGDERGSSLAGAMNRMSRAERDAVELRVVEQLGYDEIASRLNCTVVAARVRVHRGLARLNDLMEAPS